MTLKIRDLNVSPTISGKHVLMSREFQSTLCKVISMTAAPISLSRAPSISESTVQTTESTRKDRATEEFYYGLTPDPMKIGPVHSKVVAQLYHSYAYAIQGSKWAHTFWMYISYGRKLGMLSSGEASSLKWIVCQYVRRDLDRKEAHVQALRITHQRQQTTFAVAVQCLTGVEVIKYGRKGKPYKTSLVVKGKESVGWISKHSLLKRSAYMRNIPLVSVLDIRPGQTTKVFLNAQRKGVAGDPSHCLSLITPDRTLDLRARSTEQRDWLITSFQQLVEHAVCEEKASSRHVEYNIIRRLHTIDVYKHGRRGKPHCTKLTLHKNGELSWKGRSGASIYLENVIEITEGKQATEVFRRSKSDTVASHCISLVTKQRTLDLETKSEDQRDWLIVAFKYLIQRFMDRRAAIQREMMERHQNFTRAFNCR